MKIKWKDPKPYRFNRYYYGVRISGGDFWFEDGKWITPEERDYYKDACNMADCKTVRAFRRMLRKNPRIKGKATLVSKFEGVKSVSG